MQTRRLHVCFPSPSPQYPTHRDGAAPHTLGFLERTTSTLPEVRREARGPAVLKSEHMALMRTVNRLNPKQWAVSLEYPVRPNLRLNILRHPQGSSIGAYSV